MVLLRREANKKVIELLPLNVYQFTLKSFSGYDHETLYINNRNRGPEGDTNTIVDYTDLSKEQGHTWILGECQQHGSVEKRKRRGKLLLLLYCCLTSTVNI